MIKSRIALLLAVAALCGSCSGMRPQEAKNEVFPHAMPTEKPDYPLSASVERMFDNYPAPRAQDNEFYTMFKYTKLQGFDYTDDGLISRRDPSRPIFVDGKYYVWYTKRHTEHAPIGVNRAAEATDKIPSSDWDLCDIWYATSEDGFTWQEQGVAVARPSKPALGWRSVATPDILVWKGRYYLYFQAFNEPSGLRGDWCPVSMAHADSPEGPWIYTQEQVLEYGKDGEWDRYQTHDPQPIVYDGKIYMYYKSAYNKWEDKRDKYAVAHGLAVAEDPFGPFEKCPLNPVSASGHETCYFPYRSGVASVIICDGNERGTVQYAEDGINFEVQCGVSLAPIAGGLFTPDAFENGSDRRGGTWGLSHFTNVGTPGLLHSEIARFDCDLSQDCNDPFFKTTTVFHKPEVYYNQGLGGNRKKREESTRNFKN